MTVLVATIYDVAKLARVSTHTVSCVVNQSAPVSPELTARIYNGDLKLYSEQAELVGITLTVKCADGAVRTFYRITAPIRDTQGNINGVVTVLTDIGDFVEPGDPVN